MKTISLSIMALVAGAFLFTGCAMKSGDKCGSGKCGSSAEKKCGSGKCGSSAEKKCGSGKCGSAK